MMANYDEVFNTLVVHKPMQLVVLRLGEVSYRMGRMFKLFNLKLFHMAQVVFLKQEYVVTVSCDDRLFLEVAPKNLQRIAYTTEQL